MSLEMEQAADAILQAAGHLSSQDDLSDVEIEGDGSSSLSDIEDKDIEQEEDEELSDALSNPSEDDNDSEAETERLEDSPNKFRPHRDVVLNSHNASQIYERSPSKLHKQFTVEDLEDEEDDEPLSDDEVSINDSLASPKSSNHDEGAPTTAPTSLEDEVTNQKSLLAIPDMSTNKRKRSIMAGSSLDVDLEEPLRKRTGSIMAPVNDYAIEDGNEVEEENEQSNPQSGNISDEEDVEEQDREPQPDNALVEDEPELPEAPPSPKRRGRRKKKGVDNGLDLDDETVDAPTPNGEQMVDHEGEDEAEANARNEEELEKKRLAYEQLGDIEKHFMILKERLYDDRLAQLNKEEAMLKQSKPTHPELLAMLKCLEDKRDERIRVANKRRELDMQTLKVFAVAGRSQILSQYQQEVRESREEHVEQVGKQWYEIQHDRRSYAGSVPDYTIKFPSKRPQQVQNQVAYSTEVSVLAGISKYVGFPAAPPMRPATTSEIEEDFAKMGRSKPTHHAVTSIPYQELAALRSAGTSRYKTAEEQFFEQNPWANPQHPSHAHLIQRQSSAHHIRACQVLLLESCPQAQRSNIWHFSTNSALSQNPNGRVSPLNPFTNTHTIVPSPLGSRQTSESPLLSRAPQPESRLPPSTDQDVPISLGVSSTHSRPRDFAKEVRREQTVGQF